MFRVPTRQQRLGRFTRSKHGLGSLLELRPGYPALPDYRQKRADRELAVYTVVAITLLPTQFKQAAHYDHHSIPGAARIPSADHPLRRAMIVSTPYLPSIRGGPSDALERRLVAPGGQAHGRHKALSRMS